MVLIKWVVCINEDVFILNSTAGLGVRCGLPGAESLLPDEVSSSLISHQISLRSEAAVLIPPPVFTIFLLRLKCFH